MSRIRNAISWLLPLSVDSQAGESRQVRRSRSRAAKRSALPGSPESLERRQMLTASPMTIHTVSYEGELVEAVKDEYVVRMPQLNASTATSIVDYASKQPAIRRHWTIEPLGTGFYKLTAPGANWANVQAWAKGQNALYVQPNAVHRAAATPNDPLYAAAENWAFPQISASEAWDTSTGATSTIVAVLDTGIDYNHEDLVDNMWRNPNEIPGNGFDDDSNGVVDDIYGMNGFSTSANMLDDNGHGTFSAGLIGAVGDNALGMSGVNWAVQMMGVKVLNSSGVGTTASIVAGANYVTRVKVAGQAISTVNCGFARSGFNQAEFDSFQQLGLTGVVIVCAAGNEGNDNDANPRYPANFDIPTLISVAASTPGDTLAPFSNYGSSTVDLAAPGDDVLSTRLATELTPWIIPYASDVKYGVGSGTSFASALVAGTSALLKVVKPTASGSQIKNAILQGVDVVPGLTGAVATGGRLNVAESVDLITATIGAVPVASFKAGQVTQVIEGNSRFTVAEVRVVLDRPVDPGKNAAVFYETRPGGSAFSDVDFVAQSGYVTFSGSQTERVIRLRIMGDRIPEPNEQFAVRLVQARSRGVDIGDTQLNITIVDDDYNTRPIVPEPTVNLEPRVSITPRVVTDATGTVIPVREGNAAEFIVSLDRVSTKQITVNYRTQEAAVAPVDHARAGLDYVSTSGTLVFKPGEFTKVISVKTLKDNIREPIDPVTGQLRLGPDGQPLGEELTVVLFQPTNAVVNGGQGVASLVIQDVVPTAPAPPPGAGGFTITVKFANPAGLSTSQQQVFSQAAARWEEIIVGDLPDVVDPATGETIDDVLIEAEGVAIDGVNGKLGQAGPTEVRSGANGLPWKGVMQFDTADLAVLEASGELFAVIMHEMAHVLGFGTLWSQFGLVEGAGSANPIYVGANAVREYNSLFGVTGTSVPVENQGGPGTAGGHWRETVFGAELMTGFLNSGVPNPVSRVTIGQFEDLGYSVDYTKADAYSPAQRGVQGRALPIQLPVRVSPTQSGLPRTPVTSLPSPMVTVPDADATVQPSQPARPRAPARRVPVTSR